MDMDEKQFETFIITLREVLVQRTNGWERHVTTILVALVTVGIIWVGSSIQELRGELNETRSEIRITKFQVSLLVKNSEKDSINHVNKFEYDLLEDRVIKLEEKGEKSGDKFR